MRTATSELTLAEALQTPLAQRVLASQQHIAMVLGYDGLAPGHYIAEQRQALEQAIAELQAAQAELDLPAGGTD